MTSFILAALLAVPSSAAEKPGGLAALFKRASAFLNKPVVKGSHRRAAVAAVRGGIPTEQGEDLDQRLLDRERALRAALLSPAPGAATAADLRRVHEALAASQWVQALAVTGGGEARADAAASLSAWAEEAPALPAAVKTLLTGPASRVDDRELVKAGWGGYVRALTAARPLPPADARYARPPAVARLDETLAALKASWLEKTLPPEEEARAHALAGQAYAGLAAADHAGKLAAGQGVSRAAAPAAAAVPQESGAVLLDNSARAPSGPFDPRAVYQRAAPSVVFLLCSSEDGSGEIGTGSVIDAAGRVLTNSHVVIRDSTGKPWPSVRAYLKPAKMTGDPKRDLRDPVEGKVVAWDPALDLALVEFSFPRAPKPLALGDPDAIEVGERVAAIGHPEQGGLWTLTTGIVSTLVADLGGVKGKDAFQTDASINRGNSGGPLLDASGRIVGVNTSMSRKAADGLAITAINFAVRADVAKTWLSAKGGVALSYGRGAALAPASPAVPAARPLVAAMPTAPPKAMMVTESKPCDLDKVMEEEMREMEALGEEMSSEIKKRSGR